MLRLILASAKRLSAALVSDSLAVRTTAVRSLIERIVVGERSVTITIKCEALGALERTLQRQASTTLMRRGSAIRLISASSPVEPREADPKLVALLSRAQDWFERLATGKATAIEAIAEKEQVTSSWVARVIHLAFLAPDIAQAIIDGRQPLELTADRLMRSLPLPMNWQAQREQLGF